MGKVRDLTGQIFGRLEVIERAPDYVSSSGHKRARWHCRCECGAEKDIASNLLIQGNTKSCGCLQKELSSKRSLEDLSGRRFGRLVVIRRAEDRVSVSGEKRVRWICLCDCGKDCIVTAKLLKNGMTQSCGCYKKEQTSIAFLNDLTGQRFERWLVLSRAEDYVSPAGYHKTQWRCKCDCGTEAVVAGSSLALGTSVSCGCYRTERTSERSIKDIVGERFGRLVVWERAEDHVTSGGRRILRYKCKCDCGKTHYATSSSLLGGSTTSCGCYQVEVRANPSNFIDLAHQRFGRWTVHERAPDYIVPGTGCGNTRWDCVCDCGTKRAVLASSLLRGCSVSCGCWHQSKLEMLVVQYFQNTNKVPIVDYAAQKTFNNLTGLNGGKLRYDFLVLKDDEPYLLIECQGEQHHKPVPYFGGTEKFEIQQFHDELKREYADLLGIPLLEIPYTANTYEKVAILLQSSGV